MSELEVVTATQVLVDLMKPHIRKVDNDECISMSDRPACDAIQEGYEGSELCWVLLVDFEPACCFGVVDAGKIDGKNVGIAWMIATDKIKEDKQKFMELSHFYVHEKMLAPFDVITNFVSANHTKAVRWLTNLGFTLEAPEIRGFKGEMFHRFYLKNRGVK